MHPFSSWLLTLGINPPEVYTHDWQRVSTVTKPRKKNASIKLDATEEIGWAINYESGENAETWRLNGENVETARERSAEENARLTAALQKRREDEIRGTMRAQTLWATGTPLQHAAHAYLQKKRLDMNGCAGLKVDAEGWLLIPMWRDGKLTSVQRISPEGEKLFVKGAPTKWATFRISRPRPAMTVLCEGFATGLAIFAALPNAVVDVCFSAGNLVAVAERGEWSGMVAVAADNDHHTQENIGKNPGAEAGRKAAEIIGCGCAIPEHISGTDWHDFFMEKLAMVEKLEEPKAFRRHPAKIRADALVPIRTLIMQAARNVPSRAQGEVK